MSTYLKPGRKTYVYDFWIDGKHYYGNTKQITQEDADLFEAALKLRIRREGGDIAEPKPAPYFSDWCEVHYKHCEKLKLRTGKPKRLDRIAWLHQVVLRFCGAKPETPDSPVLPAPGEVAPFHNLTLRDFIEDPSWVRRWDDWIDQRGVSGQTRNHYNSMLSSLYTLAMSNDYRQDTGITFNPFAGRERAPKVSREVVLSIPQVQAWIGEMSMHAAVAVAIAALCPKLRLANVLALERGVHFDPALTMITVQDHKTRGTTGKPLKAPITAQLRQILTWAFGQMRAGTRHVVQYRGKPVKSIHAALEGAATAAGIPYGRFVDDGVTFHVLRHTAATMFARLGVAPLLGMEATGHTDLRTHVGYQHVQMEEQRGAYEQLSSALAIQGVVTTVRRRAVRRKPATVTVLPVAGKLAGPVVATAPNVEEIRAAVAGPALTVGRRFSRKA
jgi:integrase